MADVEPLEPAPRGHCGGRKYKQVQTEDSTNSWMVVHKENLKWPNKDVPNRILNTTAMDAVVYEGNRLQKVARLVYFPWVIPLISTAGVEGLGQMGHWGALI